MARLFTGILISTAALAAALVILWSAMSGHQAIEELSSRYGEKRAAMDCYFDQPARVVFEGDLRNEAALLYFAPFLTLLGASLVADGLYLGCTRTSGSPESGARLSA